MIFIWHRACTSYTYRKPLQKFQMEVLNMTIALSFLNAAALVALVTFQFQGNSSDDGQVSAPVQPHQDRKSVV